MNLKQLIREEVQRALQEAMKPYFDTTNYRTLNKNKEPKPNQTGIWVFDIAGEEHATPKAMTYRDAQEWAAEKARDKKVSKIKTLG